MERDLISKIEALVGSAARDPSVLLGIGDDCAVIAPSPGRHLVATTDILVESVHFDLEYFDPWHLGRKTAAVNLSDVGAMGGRPRWALLNLAIRPGLTEGFWKAFFIGLMSRLSQYGATLVGGDTVSSQDRLSVSLTLIGEIEPDKWLGRSRAEPGDLIYCSGSLGDASGGLEYLKDCKKKRLHRRSRIYRQVSRGGLRRLIARHLDPEPRVELGQALAAKGLVRSAIDLSDGIATDLAHICHMSGIGAEIWAYKVPISRALKAISKILGISPLYLALTGGEDLELLWTVSERDELEVQRAAAGVLGYRPFRIGKMVAGDRVLLRGRRGIEDITYQGYEHCI